MKKVSVIVPVYNVEKYLPQCLDSIVGQTYKNLEIICVNDDSPDGSPEILKQYAQRDSRIVIINKENGGLSSARNAGIKVADGDYTVFVDSDDWIDPETVETAVCAAERDGVETVMWTYVREFKNHSEKKEIFKGDRIFNREETSQRIHRRMAGLLGEELSSPENCDALCTAWGKLYVTRKIKDNGIEFVDTKVIGTEDVLFNLYYFAHIESCEFLDKPFNHYRKDNDSSLTKNYKSRLSQQWTTLYGMMLDFIKRNSSVCGRDFEAALYNRICLSMIGLGLNEYCSDKGFFARASKLREILRSPLYRQAYSHLSLKYFPFHWRIFFFCCKFGFSTAACAMIGAMNYLIDRKNKQ